MTSETDQGGPFGVPPLGGPGRSRGALVALAGLVLFLIVAVTKPWASGGAGVASASTPATIGMDAPTAPAIRASIPAASSSPRPSFPSAVGRGFNLGALLGAIPGGSGCTGGGAGGGGSSNGETFYWNASFRCRLKQQERASFTEKVILAVKASFPGYTSSSSSGTGDPTVWQTTYIGYGASGAVALIVVDEGQDLLIIVAISEHSLAP